MEKNNGETEGRESLKNPNPDELVNCLVNVVNLVSVLIFQNFVHFLVL